MRARIQKISRYAPSIFQGKLDLAAPRRRASFALAAEHPGERAVFRLLGAILLILASLYVYFVGATILNVVARKEAVANTAALATAVSKLERDYFALSQGVGPEDGARLGLSPLSNVVYVHRPGATAVAAVESNEI